MAILTTSGRAAVAASIKNETLYLAWGNGLSSWDALTPDEYAPSAGDNDLQAEVGRRLVEVCQYCISDASGDIVFPGDDRYLVSITPTGKLYVKVLFDFGDASDQDIRETALFQGTIPATGHETDKYLAPADIADKGILLTLDRIPKITRNTNNREIFEFILTI